MTRGTLQLVRSSLPPELRDRVASARQLGEGRHDRGERPLLPTSLAPFDRLLGGGLPRGDLVELVTRRSGGGFSALLGVLAGVTGAGEETALVDLGDGLEPAVARRAGVVLERLLWVRPRRLREALMAAETLVGGGFPLVIVDLGPPPVAGGRGAEASWLRLARTARRYRTALLVVAPYRASGTAATAVLRSRPERIVWDGPADGHPPLLAAVRSVLGVEKRRGTTPGERAWVTFRPVPHQGEPSTATARVGATPHPSAAAVRG